MLNQEAIKELFNKIQGLSRPAVLDMAYNGNQAKPELSFIYDDGSKSYKPLYRPLCRNVSDIESFISVVEMEADRKENPSGDNMTVYMTQKGGVFYPFDSKICQDSYTFNRKLSEQWVIINSLLDRDLTHRELLAVFRKLKPSINKFDEIYTKYLDLKFLRNFELTSSPVISQDTGGAEIANIKYQIANGNEKTMGEKTLPVEFELSIPYSKAGQEYPMTIEIIISIGEGGHQPVFTFVCPEIELIEEQAIKDETGKLRGSLSELTDLYVHNNF